MQFNIDSWPWKIAVVVALLVTREFVRVLSPKEKNGERGETSKWLMETIDSAAIAIGLVLFIIQPFILQAFFIPSGSMEDTLRIGDRLLVSKMVYRLKEPAFQDVIVFKAPEAALLNQSGPKDVDFIKRCMGLPGDTVEIRKRRFFRNGVEVKEPYTRWSDPQSSVNLTGAPDEGTHTPGARPEDSYDMKIVGEAVYSREYETDDRPGPWRVNNEKVADADQQAITNAKSGKVPEGYYLFLGDHRNNSNDGHVWGFAPRNSMVGKAICVFWPPTRLGLVDRMSFHPRKP